MTRSVRRLVCLVSFVALPLLTSSQAHADVTRIPSEGNFLTDWDPTSLTFIVDGTSNTIAFTENTRLAVCVDGVRVGGAPLVNPITDGSSNTLQFGESAGFAVNAGIIRSRRPVGQITDGSSNTIELDEIAVDSFCLGGVIPIVSDTVDGTSNTIVFGEESRFDACADNVRVGQIADGTSNTIIFGEVIPRFCVEDVLVREAAEATAAEPVTLLLCGTAALGLAVRRRKKT